METPNLDNLINDLKAYDRSDMLSEDGRNQLNEYEAIKRALSLHNVVNRRELLLDFADYSERDKASQTTDECVDNYLDSIK